MEVPPSNPPTEKPTQFYDEPLDDHEILTDRSAEDILCSRLAAVDTIIKYAEQRIDRSKQLYLFTWTPDPSKMPDCDFANQHKYLVDTVINYLRSCDSGCACVESTQLGNPHYHGWYQISDDPLKEQYRIVIVKVMTSFGNLKINTKVRYYKIHKWYKHRNALHYYKYDSANSQLFTMYNPITEYTDKPVIFLNDYNMFFNLKGKKSVRKIKDMVSQLQDLENFYKKSFQNIV